MKTKKYLIILGFFMLPLLALVMGDDANAQVCQYVPSSVNASVERACASRPIRTGALWLSDTNAESDLKYGVDLNTNSGKATVYLRGTIICFINDGEHCLREGGSKATYVKLVRGSNYISGTDYDNVKNYEAFSGVPTSFWRPQILYGNNITASAYSITLDIDKMMELEGNKYKVENGRRIYNLDIQAYRCMEGSKPSWGAEYCDSDTVVLRVSIPEPQRFQAEAIVGGESTGYTTQNDKGVSKYVNCGNVDGCNVNFKFNMKRLSSVGSSNYRIQKKTNRGTSDSDWDNVAWGKVLKNGTFPTNGNPVWNITEEKVSPGIIVCYRIIFKPKGNDVNEEVLVKACAYGEGTLTSKIRIEAKKNTGEYGTNTIYAKPKDTITLKGTYTPLAQYGYNLKPNSVVVDDQTNTDGSKTVGARFNTLIGNSPGWNNAFSVTFDENGLIRNYSEASGIVTKYSSDEIDSYIDLDDPGSTFTAKAITNYNDKTKTSPSKITIDHVGHKANERYKVTVDPSAQEATLNVVVPYNFINTTEVDPDDKVKDNVYAGEDVNIPYSITTNPKANRTVTGNDTETYATIVREAKSKIQMRVNGGSWQDFGLEEGQTLNENDTDLNGNKDKPKLDSIEVKIPDVKAGTEICFRSAVYPDTSGGDTSIDPNGNGEWAFSKDEKCYPVAKRPSLQVWGGNIYSNGAITTSVAAKKRLQDEEGEQQEGTFVFGSWGELGVISSGTVTGLASGAGYAYNTGANNIGFCFVSTLSFNNNNCSRTTGSLRTSFGVLDDDKKLIIEKLTNAEDVREIENLAAVSNGALDDWNRESGIVLIKSEDSIVDVDGDITYSGTYNSLESIPKVVIYAKNINIHCDVTRIDALIIAEDEVNTCSNIEEINDAGRSVQLKVNGAIIANKLVAGRTYGAATGTNSGVPAEIINFDPSLYLWGGDAVKTDPNSSLVTSYQRELSPRY